MVLFTGHEMTQHSKLGYSSTEAPFKRCNFKDKLRVVLTMVTNSLCSSTLSMQDQGG